MAAYRSMGRWAGLLLAAALAPTPLGASEPAGQVITASGSVTATAPDREDRALERRSPVFVGDTVHTAADSRAQIRFADGGLVALGERSALRVDTFRSADDERGGASVMELLKGSLRSVTGAIGRTRPEAYRLDTELATIGIRGTYFELFLADALSVAVWRGAIRVANRAGAIDLGDGADYRFALVRSADEPPEGRLEPPPGIGESDLPPLDEERADTQSLEAGSGSVAQEPLLADSLTEDTLVSGELLGSEDLLGTGALLGSGALLDAGILTETGGLLDPGGTLDAGSGLLDTGGALDAGGGLLDAGDLLDTGGL